MASTVVTVLAGGVLLAGCGSAGADRAGDDTTSAPSSASSSVSASASASTSDSASATTSATGEPSATASSSSAAPLPACSSVWVDGQTLPLGYAGCVAGDTTVTAAKQPCEFGKPLVTFRKNFWAIANGTVHRVSGPIAKDPGWRHALVQCGG